MTKRIMREFTIDEISAVDHPAQKGARMAIMKRDDVEPIRKVVTHKEDDRMQFEQHVEQIRMTERCSGTQAMEKARERYPVAFAKFQQEGHELVEKAARDAVPPGQSKAETEFEARVEELRDGRKISRVEAMQLARRLYPEEFKAYQAA